MANGAFALGWQIHNQANDPRVNKGGGAFLPGPVSEHLSTFKGLWAYYLIWVLQIHWSNWQQTSKNKPCEGITQTNKKTFLLIINNHLPLPTLTPCYNQPEIYPTRLSTSYPPTIWYGLFPGGCGWVGLVVTKLKANSVHLNLPTGTEIGSKVVILIWISVKVWF